MNQDQPAGMSTISFKDGTTITAPFPSFKVRASHILLFIDGNQYTFNRRLLNALPEELEAIQ